MKKFRPITSNIPFEDPTVVLHDCFKFANTTEEKLALIQSVAGWSALLYVVWPGKHETHVFQGTARDVMLAFLKRTARP